MNNRIQPLDPSTTTGKTKDLFEVIQKKVGMVPNAFRVFGNSSAALEGYLSLSGSLSGGELPAGIREQIALTVSEINGCAYCLSSHVLTAKAAGVSKDDIHNARRATASDEKADAALKLARAITLEQGRIEDSYLTTARSAGLSEAEIVEVVFHVALTILTNYVNNVAEPVIEFPLITPGQIPESAVRA